MLTILSTEGYIKAYSQNLNVFFHYERRNGTLPILIEMTKLPAYSGTHNGGNGHLKVTYANGDCGEVHFGSHEVMKDWVLKRHAWKGKNIPTKYYIEKFENGSCLPIEEVEVF